MAFISPKSLSVSSNDSFVSFQVCLSIFSIKLQVQQKPIKHDTHHSIDNNTPAEPINQELMIRHRVTTRSSSNHLSSHNTILNKDLDLYTWLTFIVPLDSIFFYNTNISFTWNIITINTQLTLLSIDGLIFAFRELSQQAQTLTWPLHWCWS